MSILRAIRPRRHWEKKVEVILVMWIDTAFPLKNHNMSTHTKPSRSPRAPWDTEACSSLTGLRKGSKVRERGGSNLLLLAHNINLSK